MKLSHEYNGAGESAKVSLGIFILWNSSSTGSPGARHPHSLIAQTLDIIKCAQNEPSEILRACLLWPEDKRVFGGEKKFQKAAYKEVTISKTHQQTPKKQFPISIKNDEKGNKEHTWASDLSFGLNTRGQQKTSQRSLWKELIHRHQLYFIVLAMKAEGKKILGVANWECGRFPTGSVWVLTLHSKVERHDTTSSLTPMLIYSQQRQKKNNINNCFSRSD